MTKAARAAHAARVAELQRIREKEESRQHADAARRAQEILDQSAPATSDHPYLQTKQIQPHGVRMDELGRLIVPVEMSTGRPSSLQFIDGTGAKRFLHGGKIQGGFFTFGDLSMSKTILLCEGFATGASLHEATGYNVACCFSAGNLRPVAEVFRRRYPSKAIIIAADNDLRDDGTPNVGMEAAIAAADAVHGILAMPELDKKKCDFSDVHVQCGFEAVRKTIEAALTNEEKPAMSFQTVAPDMTDESLTSDAWPILHEAAYSGLLGALTRTVEPFSEADPVGILLHGLLISGASIGSRPHVLVEHTPHFARTNCLFVGVTAGGRKGTAFGPIRHIFSRIDEAFIAKRVKSGLSSAEGLIYQVRDPSYEKEPIRAAGRRNGDILGYEDRLVDPGEPDKRLVVIESEFSSTLTCMEREGNTLSPTLRDTWDHGNLSPLTKKDRLVSTKAHVSIIGHVTSDELLRKLSGTDRSNGFSNRFLFALVQQSKFLPSGKGTPSQILEPYFVRFSRTLERARTREELFRDAETEQLWASVYRSLAEIPQGLTGAILARGAAQVLRLSLIYSLMDERESERTEAAIRAPHLMAALALWDFCRSSVLRIFGDCVGDPIADRLLKVIKARPQTDTDLYEVLGKHEGDRNRKGLALDLLQRLDRVHRSSIPTAGRPSRSGTLALYQGARYAQKGGNGHGWKRLYTLNALFAHGGRNGT